MLALTPAAAGEDTSSGVTSRGVEELLEALEEEEERQGEEEGCAADAAEETRTERAEPPGQQNFDLSGSVSARASVAYAKDEPEQDEPDYRGLVRLPIELDLQLDLRLPRGWSARVGGRAFYDFAFAIKGHSQFADEALDSLESEIEATEVYVQGSPHPHLDVKLGRQIVNWGRSDHLRVLDVLNPLDLREPGLVDLEDLRLPTTMTRIDYFRDEWRATAVAIHEIRFNEGVVPGSDFVPSSFDFPENDPPNTLEHTEYGLSVSAALPGWGVSLHAARVFDDEPHLAIRDRGLVLRHARLGLLGAGGSAVLGNWRFFGEFAWVEGLEFFWTPDEEKSRIDALLGFEYGGWDDSLVVFEVAHRHLDDYDPALERAPDFAFQDEATLAFRYDRNFWHDTLRTSLLALIYGWNGEGGGILRLSADYQVTDRITLGGGVLAYHGGRRVPFVLIGDNDRLFLRARYSF